MEPTAWARVSADNIVVNVELATADWVAGWTAEHPDSPERYIESELGTIRQASIGWAYNPDDGMFYPPKPSDELVWIERLWNWMPPQPAKPEGDNWEWSDEYWTWVTPKPEDGVWLWNNDTQEWEQFILE
jgi:hypothetical protein